MKLSDLKIDTRCLGKKMLLIDVLPVYAYEDNVRTDKVTGYRYVVVLEELRFEKLGVKIYGDALMEKPEEGFKEVVFENLELHPYILKGNCEITAIATGVREVKTGQ